MPMHSFKSHSDCGSNQSSLVSNGDAPRGISNAEMEASDVGPQSQINDADAALAIGKPTTSMRESTINLICGGLGTGMFSLPWAIAGSSIIPAIVIIIGTMCLNVGTIAILVFAAEAHNKFDLGALLGMLPGRMGKCMQILTNFSIWFVCILTLIGYIVAIHDSAVPLVKNVSWLNQDRTPLLGIAAVAVLPLCYLDQKYLAFSSVLAVLVNVNLLIFVFALFGERTANHNLGPGICWLGFGKGLLTMVNIMVNSIVVQMCILPMYEVLEDRTPQKFLKVLFLAFGCLAALLVAFSVLAYMAIGDSVQGNVLKNLPVNAWSSATQAGMIVVIMAVYPIFLLPMLAPLENMDLKHFRFGAPDPPEPLVEVAGREATDATAKRRRRLTVNGIIFAIVVISFLGACFLTQLGFINEINGAICVGIFVCGGPALVGLYLLGQPQAIEFAPGKMGVTCDDTGLVQEVVPNAQAHNKGIKEGDRIVKVLTAPFSKDGLSNAEGSGDSYEVTVRPSGDKSFLWKVGMCSLIAFGAIACVVGVIFTDNYKEELGKHCAL